MLFMIRVRSSISRSSFLRDELLRSYDKGVPVADEYLVSGMIGKLQDMNIPIYLFSIYKKEMIVTLVELVSSLVSSK